MKNKILLLMIMIVSACTSLPKTEQKQTLNTLIQKPELNYKINSLPKKINIYFYQEEQTSNLPDEVMGFLVNSYAYNSKLFYKPKISIRSVSKDNCPDNSNEGIFIAFNLDAPLDIAFYERCISKLPKSKTLYLHSDNRNLGFPNSFDASKDIEKKKLIQNIPREVKRIVVIDSEHTLDKDEISNFLELNGKEIIERRTFNESISSQDLFSEILLSDRSKERKRKLSRRISKEISGEARIREDIDAFFLSINLDEARNLKPALDYISEENFKVYFLNNWESKSVYQLAEKDLEGLITADFPIMIPANIPQYILENYKTREFAIGYDAFEIVMLQYGAGNLRGFTYKGLSGNITFDNQIKREPIVFKVKSQELDLL